MMKCKKYESIEVKTAIEAVVEIFDILSQFLHVMKWELFPKEKKSGGTPLEKGSMV